MSLTAAPTPVASYPPAPTPAAAEEPMEFEIRPRSGWIAIDWKELFSHRELLFFLVWRDVKVRYKQTVLGVAWAVLQPVFNVILFTCIFGRMANFDKRVVEPYALWVYASMLPWSLIGTGVTTGGMSLVNSQNLLTKIYFPRLFVPAASVGGALMDMLVSFLVFFGLAASYGTRAHLHWTLVFLPLLTVMAVMISLGLAYILSALTVKYRDFRFVIPFLTQALMYGSFVMIPLPGLKFHWVAILSINPIFGVTSAFRAAAFGDNFQPLGLAISIVTASGLLLLGLFYFRRTERRFADIA